MMRAWLLRSGICFCLTLAGLGLTGCNSSQHGEELFDLHCVNCHEMENPELKKRPPKLEGIFSSSKLPSGAPATDEQVRKTILKGFGAMPSLDRRLSPSDVDDVIRYLHTLK